MTSKIYHGEDGMAFTQKDVPETVTRARTVAQCDGCGQEIVLPGTHNTVPSGWATIKRYSPHDPRDTWSSDANNTAGAKLACSRLCATNIAATIYNERGAPNE